MDSFSSDQHEDNGVDEQPEQGMSQATYLEIARQIARETLEADHQALELHARVASAAAVGSV